MSFPQQRKDTGLNPCVLLGKWHNSHRVR